MGRVKCFLCGKWILSKHAIQEEFYGDYEEICPGCDQRLVDGDRLDEENKKLLERNNAERIE